MLEASGQNFGPLIYYSIKAPPPKSDKRMNYFLSTSLLLASLGIISGFWPAAGKYALLRSTVSSSHVDDARSRASRLDSLLMEVDRNLPRKTHDNLLVAAKKYHCNERVFGPKKISGNERWRASYDGGAVYFT